MGHSQFLSEPRRFQFFALKVFVNFSFKFSEFIFKK